MKKLLGILTAAALLFSAVSCAQDDGVMTMSEAYDGAGSTAELVTNVANFTLKTSDGTAVTELELAKGGSTTLTSSLKGIEASATIGGYVNVTVSDTTVTITGRSAGTDYIIFTYSGMDCGYLKVTVTPKETYQVSFNGLAAGTLTATISDSSYIASATPLAYTTAWTATDSLTAAADTNIADSNNPTAGYKIADTGYSDTVAAGEWGTFYTTVTAAKKVTLDSVSFVIGSTKGGQVTGAFSVKVDDTTVKTVSGTSTKAKKISENLDLSSEGLTLDEGESATLVVHVNYAQAKATPNFGIASLVISATAAE